MDASEAALQASERENRDLERQCHELRGWGAALRSANRREEQRAIVRQGEEQRPIELRAPGGGGGFGGEGRGRELTTFAGGGSLTPQRDGAVLDLAQRTRPRPNDLSAAFYDDEEQDPRRDGEVREGYSGDGTGTRRLTPVASRSASGDDGDEVARPRGW